MCRNIKPLFNFDPPTTPEEVDAAALQYVRKVSGMTKPSQANQEAFDAAVHEIAAITLSLLESLTTTAPPKNRDDLVRQARERGRKREERLRERVLAELAGEGGG